MPGHLRTRKVNVAALEPMKIFGLELDDIFLIAIAIGGIALCYYFLLCLIVYVPQILSM